MTITQNTAPEDPVDSALAGVAIPSCPRTLTELQHELASDTPDIRKVTNSVSNDIALSVAVLRTVNSPIYALPKQVANIAQAVSMLGLRRLGVLVTNTLIRQALKFDVSSRVKKAHWPRNSSNSSLCFSFQTLVQPPVEL
jgi:HD-like signal output (HDOD) protein